MEGWWFSVGVDMWLHARIKVTLKMKSQIKRYMIPVSLFYVLISWVVVLLLKFVMDQLFESQSYEILDNQTQFFQEHSTETDMLCFVPRLCLVRIFWKINFFICYTVILELVGIPFFHFWLVKNIQSSAWKKVEPYPILSFLIIQ
jgi:hypothetical protein